VLIVYGWSEITPGHPVEEQQREPGSKEKIRQTLMRLPKTGYGEIPMFLSWHFHFFLIPVGIAES
jgi:hypothetical protein